MCEQYQRTAFNPLLNDNKTAILTVSVNRRLPTIRKFAFDEFLGFARFTESDIVLRSDTELVLVPFVQFAHFELMSLKQNEKKYKCV